METIVSGILILVVVYFCFEVMLKLNKIITKLDNLSEQNNLLQKQLSKLKDNSDKIES